MKEILFNLALIDLIKFCKDNGLDCSGSHAVKSRRCWTYTLINDQSGRAIVTVTFSKNATPTHTITNN
jgi:hypothetical protein